MNIFYLHSDEKTCAEMHNNSHCVKMILEYSQLLSTAHRVLDGHETSVITDKGRKAKRWLLSDDRNDILYSATHINHPSAIWVRQSHSNYIWLSKLLKALCREYTYRYGKIHKCESSGLVNKLFWNFPKNIPKGSFTQPTPAMPDIYKVVDDSIASYRNYYNGAKTHLAKWKNRNIPEWFQEQLQ
jgi:hypothetical protein